MSLYLVSRQEDARYVVAPTPIVAINTFVSWFNRTKLSSEVAIDTDDVEQCSLIEKADPERG